jgi:hypothetical protein
MDTAWQFIPIPKEKGNKNCPMVFAKPYWVNLLPNKNSYWDL